MAEMIRFNASAMIEAKAGDSKQPARISILAYSGGLMSPAGWSNVVIDLQGADVSGDVPILAGHQEELDAIAGQGRASIREGALYVDGILTDATTAGQKVIALGRSGVSLQASIGYSPQTKEYIRTGQSVQVNARTLKAGDEGLTIIRTGRLREVSLLPVGADATTHVSISARKGNQTMSTDNQVNTPVDNPLQAAWEAPGLSDPQRLRARYRALDVADANLCQEAEDLFLEACAAGTSPTQFDLQLTRVEARDGRLRAIRAERPKAPAIHSSTRDESPSIIEAAFARTCGLPDWQKTYSPQVCDGADRQFRGGLSLQELLLTCAESSGYSGGRRRITGGNLREILGFACGPMIRAAGTMSLPGLLSNVANKELLAGFTEEDQTWREIAAIKPVSDFKAVTSYRMLDNLEYEEVPPGGTIKHGTVSEESYTRQARTYAKMFALTRQDIINDDLGAFDDIRVRLGRGAARKFNGVFWAKFVNNSSFFTAARGNYISGGTTNLGTDYVGLELGLAAFRALRSATVAPATTGPLVGGAPTILLVPSELESNAIRLFAPIAAATAATVNVYSSRYRPVMVSQLSDNAYTGNSATAWYLFRNPAILAPMVVSFLDNVQTPVIDSADADFDQLGIQFRGYHDFGCDQAEWLCGVKSKGAA